MTWLLDWAELSLPQQVAQLIVVRASGFVFDHQIQYPQWEPPTARLNYWIDTLGVGGVLLLGGSAVEVGVRSHQLQSWATVPLLVCADIEEGVGQRFSGATWFPPPMALGAIAQGDREQALALARKMGAITAHEAKAIGINWLLAPVVDVNNNPNNPVINVRAFSDRPEWVSQLTTAFIHGAKQQAVLTTAKHFPGHGDTAVDSHLDLPIIPHTLERLRQIELPPFAEAIAAGVDAVMSAHLLIPELDADLPATLSPRILTGELRQQMGFSGLITTDALVMGAIADRFGAEEAAVMAIEAGADIVLMPFDPEVAIQAIVEAIEIGRISIEQIHDSLERIWHCKHRVCAPDIQGDHSHDWERQMPESAVQILEIPNRLAQPEAIATVNQILDASLVVIQPAVSRLMQQVEGRSPFNLIIVEDALNCDFLGRQAAAMTIPAQRGYQLAVVDRQTPIVELNADRWAPTLLQVFIRGNPFRGSLGLARLAEGWLRQLVEREQLQGLVVYGSPYIWDDFRLLLPPDVAAVFSYGQMPAAQAIAMTALFQNCEQPAAVQPSHPFTT